MKPLEWQREGVAHIPATSSQSSVCLGEVGGSGLRLGSLMPGKMRGEGLQRRVGPGGSEPGWEPGEFGCIVVIQGPLYQGHSWLQASNQRSCNGPTSKIFGLSQRKRGNVMFPTFPPCHNTCATFQRVSAALLGPFVVSVSVVGCRKAPTA